MEKQKQAAETGETLYTAMEDRISQVPIPILHHILCFLSQKEAVRTCLLSKQWRHIGTTRPNLDFSELWFDTQEKFVSVVDRTLQGYCDQNLSILKLDLEISRPQLAVSLLDKWIPTIPALKLKFPFYDILPSAVFVAESLEELHLFMCRVSPVESVRFKRLRTLTLEWVLINVGTFESIMLGCPMLERMALFSCLGLRNVRLVSEVASRGLKHFELDYFEGGSIEIDVPNLETVRIKGPWIWSNRQSALLFSRLTSLDLNEVILSSESFDLLSFGCPTLESLTLNNCSGFKEFHLASDTIKWLTISTRIIPLKGVTICAPNIVHFEFTARIPQVPDTFSFTTTTSKEWDSNVIFHLCEEDPDFDVNVWFLKLRRMLKALSGSQISVILQMNGGPQNVPCSAVVSDEPPVAVRDLNFDSCKWRTASWYMGFTNGLFRVCRPSHVCGCWFVDKSAGKYRLSAFQLNILLADKKVRTEPYFWRHDLEQVFVETLDGQQWQLMQWTKPGNLRKRKQDGIIRLRLKWRC
ncbi:F-box/RNI-like superfamily protein [Striga asiatica]|uniref:F-box/RNI-like superfamily protein n=1 Tax=Striga asiatica TaxID=4170 RepID=A0A5A7QUW7_STRAF|nr:F-box/RNI-like superfamily protein [Striga asiatica]